MYPSPQASPHRKLLPTPIAGHIQLDPDVRGDATHARVVDAEAVDHQDVDIVLYLPDSGHHGGGLAVGKQAGDVGEL